MKKMKPQLSSNGSSNAPVERKLLLVLTACVCLGTVLLLLYTPPVTTLALFIAYSIAFICLRLLARTDGKVDRSAPSLVKPDSYRPSISIIVPAHNEAAVIGASVQLLLQQDYPNYELLVVDDRSTDGTENVLRSIRSNTHCRYRYYTRSNGSTPGKSAVLNEALEQTEGEIIAVFDADAQIEPDFLSRMVPYFADSLTGAAQARKVLFNAEENFLTRCQQYEYCMDAYIQVRRDTIRSAVELRGNGMLLRRTALEALGGLNEHTRGEDLDLCTRMHVAGWDIRYDGNVIVKEEGLTKLGPLMQQRIRWTETSIIRYLENASQILFNPQLALRTKMDASLFVFEFIGPLWLFLENILLTIRWLTGHMAPQTVLFATPAMTVLSLYFVYASFQGISRFDRASLGRSIQGTAMVYFYLSFLWLPIVFYLTFKILSRKERHLVWENTPHYGVAVE
jgi:1,2-diacylglycerol 3-beta-glucosyltransferase